MKALVHASATRPVSVVPVFIAYADVPSARVAMTRVTQLLQASQRDSRLEPMLWRLDQLHEARWHEMALTEAIRAHTLVLAMSNASAWCARTGAWLSALAARAVDATINVLALLGEDESWTVSLQPTRRAAPARARAATASLVSAAPLRVELSQKRIARVAA